MKGDKMDRNYALKFIIEQYMTTHNLKQYEFADKCEVSKSFINKICNRKQGKFNVSEMYFIRLAKGMGITSDELHKMLEDIETTNTKKIADLILNEAIDNNFGVIKDDMSVMVCKFKEKEDE